MKEEKIVRFFEEIGLAKGIANIKKFEQEIMIPEIIKAKKEVFDDIENNYTEVNKELFAISKAKIEILKRRHLGEEVK